MKSVFLAIVLAFGITACGNSDRTPTTAEVPSGESLVIIKCPDSCFCVITKIKNAKQYHYKARMYCNTKKLDVLPEPKKTADAGVSTNTGEVFDINKAVSSQME